MKIIALSCSPSRGRNSDTMLDHFIKGAETNQNIEIEKIYLEDVSIENYKYENRLGPLEHEKDFAELCKKIQEAQGLVIATPTYNFSVPAHLKNFIDRMRFISLDMDKRNKLGQPVGKLKHLKTYFIVSGGTPVWAQKILFFAFPPFWLRGIFLYYSAHVMGAIYTGNVKAMKDEKVLEKCAKRGRKFALQVSRGKGQGILEQIFWRPPQA